jgi:hypothetical protein
MPSPYAIAQNVTLKLRKHGEHAGERTTPWRGHIEGLGQGDKSDADGIELLQGANQA